jgi:hypothetical protein
VSNASAAQLIAQYDGSTRLQVSVAGSGVTTLATDNTANIAVTNGATFGGLVHVDYGQDIQAHFEGDGSADGGIKLTRSSAGKFGTIRYNGSLMAFHTNSDTADADATLKLGNDDSATFAGQLLATPPSSATTDGNVGFGAVSHWAGNTTGTPSIKFTGSISDGGVGVYMVSTTTRSNANPKYSCGIVMVSKGYQNTVSVSLTTIAGNAMTISTNSNSGANVNFTIQGDGAGGGSIPSSADCIRIGGRQPLTIQTGADLS